MAAFIKGRRDNLDDRSRQFDQARLREPVFLNSVPKGGTHLIRNVLRMFVSPEQHYHHEFIQIPNLRVHARAFAPEAPSFSCGHLLFSEEAVMALGAARHILLVRDPYDWVLARARFHISDEFQQANLAHLKTGAVGMSQLLNMMILGIHQKVPALLDVYLHNAVGWIGVDGVTVVRYEDAREAVNDLQSTRSEAFFMRLLDACGIDPPADWLERVRVGADRAQSRTARENLTLAAGLAVPESLPEAQQRLVDFSAPGLRALLGYV